MKEVWIFGDSYSDKNYETNPKTFAWTHELEKHYNISNFSKKGTGPEWSLKLFHDMIHNDNVNKKNINLIFFISNGSRLDLNFFDLEDQCIISTLLELDVTNKQISNKRKKYKKYIPFIKEVWKYYLVNESIQNTYVDKSIGMINCHAHLFNKVLIWPIFKYASPLLKLEDNVTLVNIPLTLMDANSIMGYGEDTRINHIKEDNNHIMFEQLSKWIDTSEKIDVTKFSNFV